jgi:hypothetical protein
MSTDTLEAPSTGTNTQGVGRRDRQPADVVARNLAHLPEYQRTPLCWFHAHGHSNDLSTAEMGAVIGYDKAVISKLFASEMTYTGNLDNVCDAINEARERIELEEKSAGRRLPFIECNLSKHIWKLCDMARSYQRVVFMHGDSQIGKSVTLKEKAKREKGSCFYWEMPVGGSIHNFLGNAADAFGFSARRNKSELRRRVINMGRRPAKGEPMLFLIDQMHRCFSDKHGNLLKTLSKAQLDTLDFIIEMFDDANCGIVLSGTEVFREGMSALTSAGFFKQLKRRGLNEAGFPLPDLPSSSDLNTFAKAYGLKPASGEALALQTQIIAQSGLGVWITRLSMAARRAAKTKDPITWQHVVDADDFLAAAAKGKIAIEKEAA